MENGLPNTRRISIYHVKWTTKGHWFDKDAMRFFRSRVATFALLHNGKAYFTSSEQFNDESPRLYSVRVCTMETGDINTIGEFQQYKTADAARRAIARIIKAKEAEIVTS